MPWSVKRCGGQPIHRTTKQLLALSAFSVSGAALASTYFPTILGLVGLEAPNPSVMPTVLSCISSSKGNKAMYEYSHRYY